MVLEDKSFIGGIADYEDRGIPGAFKFASGIDIRKSVDSLSCQQALTDIGLASQHHSPSASTSPSASVSASSSPSVTPSPSASTSPSSSSSASQSASSGISPSPSLTPSVSVSPSASISPSSSLSPSPSVSAGITSIFTDLVRWFVEAKDGYVYGFGNTGNIYRINTTDLTVTRVYKDANGAIRGAVQGYRDNGIVYLQWATNRHVMRKPIPGNNSWNDVEIVAGNLDSADWHPMVSVGGSTYIGNKDKLALIGYDGSFTPEALDLIPGTIVKTLIERNARVVPGTYRDGHDFKGVNGAIDTEVPLSQIGTNGGLFYANMVDSLPYKYFPGGGYVNPGGVCAEESDAAFFDWEENALSWIDKKNIANMAYFGIFGASSGKNGIYTVGRRNKNKPFVMNLEYAMDVDEVGAVIVANSIVFASYQDGSIYGVVATDATLKATGTWDSTDFHAPIKNPERPTVWDIAEVYMKPLPANCSVEYWYKADRDGEFIQAKTVKGETTYHRANSKKATFRINVQADIYERRVVLNPSGNLTPEVYRVRTKFA